MKRREQQGVALVITLILLAVITIVVVAFLAVTQRNRALVTSAGDLTSAQFMADAAVERAIAETAAKMMAAGEMLPVPMAASTNYVRLEGFIPGLIHPTNASYTRARLDDPTEIRLQAGVTAPIYDPALAGGAAVLSYQEQMRNLQNLYFNPRPPVFIRTNASPLAPPEFRFYLDMNRNGRFDPTGEQWIGDEFGNLQGRTYLVGDPEWIGMLENPDAPHSATNRFIGRYAYLIVPEGLSIDINAAHNMAKDNGEFLRNTGVGTWEINLASFLVGLNTNVWPAPGQSNAVADYSYSPAPGNFNTGFAFEDARDILRYRYRSNPADNSSSAFGNLLSYATLFGGTRATLFANDGIDGYGNGPLLQGTSLTFPEVADPVNAPWSGSPSPTEYKSHDDLFSPRTVQTPAFQPEFLSRLDDATLGAGTYNANTYYRLLSQLGTVSGTEPATFTPGLGVDEFVATNSAVRYEPRDKINLNYDNREGVYDAANPANWEPIAFFSNAADRMLRSQSFVGSDGRLLCLTNIMVWPTNNYDNAVHRVLQVAANLYDASAQRLVTDSTGNLPPAGQPHYPTVFRPYLRREYNAVTGQTNVYIAGYQLQDVVGPVVNPAGFVSRSAYWDLNGTNVVSLVPENPDPNTVQPMALGVPMVVGVKKGLPNFNEMAVETSIQVQRNVQVIRPSATSLPIATNEFYILGITNLFGLEAWNSYLAAYPRGLQLAVEVDFDMAIVATNDFVQWPPIFGGGNVQTITKTFSAQMSFTPGQWGGRQFQVPVWTNYVFLTNSVYTPRSYPRFRPVGNGVFAGIPTTPNEFFIPDWNVALTNRIRYVLTDGQRIIDYANIDRMVWRTNVIDALVLDNVRFGGTPQSLPWLMNRQNGTQNLSDPTEGLVNQLMIGAGFLGTSETTWRNYAGQAISGRDKDLAIDNFRRFLMDISPQYFPGQGNPVSANGLVAQAPFTATRRLLLDRRYQVNDPLVHYTAGDLAIPKGASDAVSLPPGTAQTQTSLLNQTLGQINAAYTPWPGEPDAKQQQKDPSLAGRMDDPLYTDPMVMNSDSWAFPTNKFPNVGWMGRVHRGTPWQTLFFKADRRATLENGNVVIGPAMGDADWYDAGNSRGAPSAFGYSSLPRQDWNFVGLFTTAPSENATRGQLSVNQSGVAAWSAVLGGVLALTNQSGGGISAMAMTPQSSPVVIQPGSPQLLQIIDGINLTRGQFGGQFRSLGEILAVPQLSIDSPYLARRGNGQGIEDLVDDAAMERIPQQILSLLRLGEQRYVIYAYGQSLKPAPYSIVLDPDYTGLVTNYQITGESALRSTVRLERPPGRTNGVRAVVLETKVLTP